MLRLPPTPVIRPQDLREALEALSGPGATRVLAGGTDLLVAYKNGLGGGAALVSLTRLPLGGIEERGGGWSLGATTTLAELIRWAPAGAPSLQELSRAAALVAAPPIQSRASLGGNLCLDTRCCFYNQSAFWRSGRPPCHKAGGEVCHAVPGSPRCHACHQADLPPLLIALGAAVEVVGAAGSRTMPLEELYSGDGRVPLRLGKGELLTRVTLPKPAPAAGAAYEKLRPRKGLDFPAAAAAVCVQRDGEGRCSAASVVLGAVGSGPLRVPEAEAALIGSRLEEPALGTAAEAARKAARPVKNADLTPPYRRKVVGTLVARAARRAWAAVGPEGGAP
ncbi:MAG: FAD binding domain-containing protein [Thermodesulfobacteriota bacterium]